MSKLTQEDFIKRATKIHGEKYSYTLAVYIRSNMNVQIICNNCANIFQQTPTTHLKSKRCCPTCRFKWQSINLLSDTEEFINKSNKKYNGFFNYSKTIYVTSRTKVIITCPIHGDFEQTPNGHLTYKYGCKQCNLDSHKGKGHHQWKGGVEDLQLPLYETYSERLKIYQTVYNINQDDLNLLGVECKYCSKLFIPTTQNVKHRLTSIDTGIYQNNFYCSDKCKSSCKVYRFQHNMVDPDSILYVEKSDRQQARACQTNYLKQLQLDEIGYNYCEKCGELNAIELHHTLEIAKYGLEAISSASHILLCNKCHKDLTKQCRNK
ncbi:hypothetical protein JZU46_02875 [bacterium]|nr:hypothetical protein [bacterium]